MPAVNLPLLAAVDPWALDLVVVHRGSHGSTERAVISRDTARGHLVALRRGVHVDRVAFESLTPEEQHIVRMRALAAIAPGAVVFSHWSAAVLHGLPVLRWRLDRLHVTVAVDDERHQDGIVTHRFPVDDAELVRFDGLVATRVGRTVVDVAGAAPFDEGIITADGALRAGVPRAVLDAAIELAGPRRASRRISETVAFAHPGAESAAESRMRTSLMRLGVEVPRLQHPVRLRDGSLVFLDGMLPLARVGIEVDGAAKYLDPRMAPRGAGAAVVAEKRREDEVRLGLAALVRPDWTQAGNPAAMHWLLERVGVRPARPRTTLAEYSDAARFALPRRPPSSPSWRA